MKKALRISVASLLAFMLLGASMVFAHSERVEVKMQKNMRFGPKAEVVSVSSTSLVVKTSSGEQKTLVIDADTKLRFRGGEAAVSDFHAGDKVQIVAHKNDQGTLIADHLMNMSLRRKTVRGVVETLNGTTFTIQTKHEDDVTVKTNADTIFKNDDEEEGDDDEGSLSDVKVGSNVTVKGKFLAPSSTVVDANVVLIHSDRSEND